MAKQTCYREILRLKHLGLSEREIALSCAVSRNTVSGTLDRAKAFGLSWESVKEKTEGETKALLFPVKERQNTAKRLPDFEHVRNELARKGVTKKLLWLEYCEDCRNAGQEALMYSQFCHLVYEEEQKHHASMHITRRPGEQIEVDWAGDPMSIIDPHSGKERKVWIFVGALTYSQYTYAEGFLDQKMPSWISAHVHMYEYFGGVSRILVPDNCKTAVIRGRKADDDAKLNSTYLELAEYYGTAILPARVRKPKDKPNAEGSVKLVTSWIIAALRDETFFSLEELNEALRKRLERLNAKPFQKKEGSRKSVFLAEERPHLEKLPATPFKVIGWKTATVQFNYHISVDHMYYSVPYQYIKKKVDVRLTNDKIDIFFEQEKIASHERLYGSKGKYSTKSEHMPDSHKNFLEWSGERFRNWARRIGPDTFRAIDGILKSRKVEQQAYRSCMAILKLSDKYGEAMLEMACTKALSYSDTTSFKSIQNILIGLNVKNAVTDKEVSENGDEYSLTRGAKYYRGDK